MAKRIPAVVRVGLALMAGLLLLGTLEAGSAYLINSVLDSQLKRNVRALTGEQTEKSRKRPHTLWHHELNPEHRRYADSLNTKGTLGQDFDVPKPSGELRVLALGDSTTEGHGLDWQEAYPYLLERQLEPRISEIGYGRVRVINAGIGSHNSAFNLQYLALRLIHFEPDWVVIKSAYNDYLPFIKQGMSFDYGHAFPEPFTLTRSQNPYWAVARYSAFLKLAGSVMFAEEVANPHRAFSGEVTRAELEAMDYSANRDKLHLYAENLRSMILLTRGRGIEPILLDLPTSPDSEHYQGITRPGVRFRELMARFEAEAQRVALEENVAFVVTQPLGAEDFLDHCHNTVGGHQKIAERVAAVLIERAKARSQQD